MVKFDGILNFRDVAVSVKPLAIRPGLLYRSARIDQATASDHARLTKQLKITTVIDLRTTTERLGAALQRKEGAGEDEAERHGEEKEGVRYAEINLNGKAFERALVWQLGYASLARVVVLTALGYRAEAIAILGREILLPRGLTGLGCDTLDHSGPEIRQVFDILADAAAYPVLVHCTQGKDRTGLSILLLLLLLLAKPRGGAVAGPGPGAAIAMDAIVQDYRQSEVELEPAREEMIKEVSRFGLDESFLRCPADFCHRISEHLDTRYGGVGSYLAGIGVDEAQQAKIRSILLS